MSKKFYNFKEKLVQNLSINVSIHFNYYKSDIHLIYFNKFYFNLNNCVKNSLFYSN